MCAILNGGSADDLLSDRCPVCLSVLSVLSVVSVLSVLSVTLVYCSQTVGLIKMRLGMQVGLGHGHTVSDGDPCPLPQRGTASPNFWPIYVVAK